MIFVTWSPIFVPYIPGPYFPNVSEYVGGSNPSDPSDAPRLWSGVEAGDFMFQFVRARNAIDAVITAEASQQLDPRLSEPALLRSAPEVVDNGDGTETMCFVSARPIANVPMLFLRLQAAVSH